jgi:YD repeat-containing protein
MKKLLVGLILLSPVALFGQAQKFPTVFPVSPDAAAFAQYAITPVNLNTGTPNISIPLYEIKTNGFTLPVSLSYHPQIKVNQMASSVGLGWTLNGGGCITRSMKGLPDENRDSLGAWMGDIGTTPSSAINVHNGNKDTEPDLFSFNFAGYSGQFIFSGDHFILDDQVLQIESDNNLLQFTITNADGIKFIFGAPSDFSVYHERTIYKDKKYHLFEPLGSYESDGHNYLTYKTTTDLDNDNVSPEGYNSAWMLRLIIFPNSADTIKFIYTPFTTMQTYTELSEDAFYPKHPSMPSSYQYINRSFCINQINQKNLSSITWPNGSVVINYNYPRKDVATFNLSGEPLPGGAYQLGYNTATSYAVSKVIIRDESNTLRKGYEFGYDYYYTNAYLTNESDPLKIRLRLKSVYEYSEGVKLPSYNFHYNSPYMPSIISAEQDYWGFCNKSDYASLNISPDRPHRIPLLKVDGSLTSFDPLYTPSRYYIPVITSDPVSATVGTYNRSMNNGAMCGVLKEVTYPTGGKITYEYSLDSAYFFMNINRVVRGGGIKISKITQDDGKGNTIIKSYTYPTSGRLMYAPQFAKRFYYSASSAPYPEGVTIYSNSLTFPSGPAVLFDSVTETQSGLGKTKYVYEIPYPTGEAPAGGDIGFYKAPDTSIYNPGSYPRNILDYFPYTPYSTYDWINGKLKSKTIYDNTNKIIQKEDYTYEINRTGLAHGYNVSLWNSEYYRDPGTSSTPEVSGVFLIKKYYYAKGWKQPSQYKKRVYNSGVSTDYIETITDYEYSDITHMTSVTKETASDGSKKITKTIYTGDFTPQTGDPVAGDNGDYAYAINKMATEKFMLNPVIETSSFFTPPSSSTEYLTSSTLTLYKEFNNNTQILPCRIFAIETATPISGYTPVAITEVSDDYTLSFHSTYKLQQEFVKYDDRANLLEIKDRNKGLASYIWGYDRSLPVAEFLNAHANEHNSYIGDEGGHLNFESGNTESEVYENNYWAFEEVNPDTTDMYSGRFCGKINPGADRKLFRDFAPTRQNQVFKFSAWIKTPASYTLGRMVLAVDGYDYQYDESNQAAYVEFGDTDGKWKYVEVLFDLGKYRTDESISEETMLSLKASIINYTSNKTLQVDDGRFAPVNSSVTTYTYNPTWDVPTSITDPSGTVTHYTYDKLGRLSGIKDQNKNIKKSFSYLYRDK